MRTERVVMCAGCGSSSHESSFARYRNKMWCGGDSCRSIIDARRRAQNRRKKMRRKERGVAYKGVPPRARHHVLRRDERRCALCGCSNWQPLQVHHIRPRSEDGSDRHTNLITLCKEDHDMVHRNMDRYRVSLSNTAIRREAAHTLSDREVARRQDQRIMGMPTVHEMVTADRAFERGQARRARLREVGRCHDQANRRRKREPEEALRRCVR